MKYTRLLSLLLFSINLFAQSKDDFESALIPKKGGAEVIYSSNVHSVILDIESDNLKPLQQPGYVNVDNKILQFVFIPNEAFNTTDTSIEFQKKLLLSYMKYETDYFIHDVKLKIFDLTTEWIMLDNKLFLFWCYSMPPGKNPQSVLQQMNLSTISFAHALNLNTPITSFDKFDESKALLLRVAKTLKQNNYKIDFEKLYQELNK